MADETQAATTGSQTDSSTTQETTTPAAQVTATPADATGTQTAEAAKTFTQADLDRIVKERLQREQSKAQELAQKAAKDAEAKALAEQGEFKRLYEQLKADADAKEQRIRQMELDTLRGAVGRRVGLPEPLISRLQGEDEAAIEADAKSLLAALPKPAAPNINSNPGNGAAPGGTLSEAEKLQLAAIYGVNPKFIQ